MGRMESAQAKCQSAARGTRMMPETPATCTGRGSASPPERLQGCRRNAYPFLRNGSGKQVASGFAYPFLRVMSQKQVRIRAAAIRGISYVGNQHAYPFLRSTPAPGKDKRTRFCERIVVSSVPVSAQAYAETGTATVAARAVRRWRIRVFTRRNRYGPHVVARSTADPPRPLVSAMKV